MFLLVNEIDILVKGFVGMGMCKIWVIGGELILCKDVSDIVVVCVVMLGI